jgi:hypothetical protein
MDVLEAHRERVAKLRDTLERLVGMHRRLFELRSESWREQVQGNLDRAEELVRLHQQIDDMESEAGLMRETLRAGLAPSEAPSPDANAPVPAR